MTVAAALAWYDEPEASLTRCVRSLEGIADVLVAYDGAWHAFPGGTERSALSQQGAVAAGALAGGIACELGHGIWRSQVAKRAEMYERAAMLADWVLVIDADEWVSDRDAERLRAALDSEQLGRAGALVAEVGLRHHDGARRNPGPARRLFSSAEGLTVERAHNGVRTKTGKWLTGDHAYVPLEEPLHLTELLTIEHANGADRPHERQVADNIYRNARRQQQLERWTA